MGDSGEFCEASAVLPSPYQSNDKEQVSMVTHQSFSQGAIPNQSPLTSADQSFLEETLVECRARLQMALEAAKGYSRLPDLGIGIGDALQGIEEALTVLNDPATYLDAYDVALSELPPTKGKVQPPESAF